AGVVMGLAYTPQGGELLYIEAVCITPPGSRGGGGEEEVGVRENGPGGVARVLGQVSVTGNVGKVMEESCQLCLDWMRANSTKIPTLM
ncbi:hypothetical protein EON63_23945, partial [archaeon]